MSCLHLNIKKIDIGIVELNKKLALSKDSEHELQNRLDSESQKLSNIQQNFRDIRNNGEINLFDFSDIEQGVDEVFLNEFLDKAENSKTKK